MDTQGLRTIIVDDISVFISYLPVRVKRSLHLLRYSVVETEGGRKRGKGREARRGKEERKRGRKRGRDQIREGGNKEGLRGDVGQEEAHHSCSTQQQQQQQQ